MERRSNNWLRQGLISVVLLGGAGSLALAQGPADPYNAAQTPAMAPQQLDNLVAPIALYPDPLLGQVLVAATYPVELVEAQQWLQGNGNLPAQQLMDAARQQNWDASVQALVAMPDVLGKLNQDIRWTTDLGNAFLAQQADVMAAVQRMRARAQANGKLQSSPQETVTYDNTGGQQNIVIQPADPEVIYVPSYNPSYIWGDPGYGYYPDLYYPSYGWYWGSGIHVGLYFGGWGGWNYGGYGWGWGPNWYGRSVFVNNYFFDRYRYNYGYGFNGGNRGRTSWSHDPGHRMGVDYRNGGLNSRYGEASRNSRISAARSGNFHSFGEGNVGNRSNSSYGNNGNNGNRQNYGGQNAGRQNLGGQNNGGQNAGRQNSNGGYQRFDGNQRGNAGSVQQQQQRNNTPATQQRYNAPVQQQLQQQRYNAPAQQQQQQRYNAPAQQQQQRYNAPQMQQRYNAPAQQQQQRYQAPAQQQQRYSAPQQSAPRQSAPNFGSNGGARSSGGGGGSAPRSFGGGGGGRSAGGNGGGGHGRR